MRFVFILLHTVTVVSCMWILIRLAARGFCEVGCDEGHSPWGYGQWVIAPKWPLLLAWTTFLIAMSTPNTKVFTIAGWASPTLFWAMIWGKSRCDFYSLSRLDGAGYESKSGTGA